MKNGMVVTGAASGIGRAVAEKLLAGEETLVAVDVDAEKLAAAYGARPDVLTVAADLSTETGLDALTAALTEREVAVKGFVHAAGFDAMAPLGLVSGETVQRLMAIHAVFPIRFLGWLGKRGHAAENAACVLISSLSAHEGAKGRVAYAAAKGAVEGLLQPAAAELAQKGIRLNEVVLGVVETEMSKGWMSKLTAEQLAALKATYPLGLGQPQDVAETIAYLLSPAARWITGQKFILDGGHQSA